MRHTPYVLIVLRVLLGPTIFWISQINVHSTWLALALIAAFLSDIFDGVIARRLKIVTPALRVADSRTDAWYFAWILITLWQTRRRLLQPYLLWIALEIGLQIFSYLFDYVKYRRITSLHAYSAKVWGLTLFLAIYTLLIYRRAFPWIDIAIGTGIISFVDGLAIKLLLPNWQHDVPSCFHAHRLRSSRSG
ncbi:CDP-alcohol phosphatidyltransferase [Chthonomonas calidirosea]|uniref:CDP-alcohol phosphatidyltransferase family protein n=1 Tax=Chthonomonas calidirosea TaxID=454171 RepID=UPI0006DD48B3|nr:CDP-alcohol phosphatidyltransferase family protein [Chthonomonas calidirosea]CEK14642.1 CDP-alcohol phosphatidyltransferase [Chthonomonas calidirosea]